MAPWLCRHVLIFLRILACLHVLFPGALTHSLSSIRPSCPDHERSALLHFKWTFLVDCAIASGSLSAYPKVKSWANDQDCCSWDGVKCDGETGHVIGLNLSSSCLHGTFPSNSSLFSLTHLQELSLAHNHFNSTPIPYELGQLTNLRSLNLRGAAFSGQVPLEVSKLFRLSVLDLSDNANPLVGSQLRIEDPSLEKLVQNLTSLIHLDLSYVDISSPVPSVLSNMTNLKFLYFELCNLHGQFPASIFGLPYLEVLDLSTNQALKGFFPEFQPNSHLRVLFLPSTAFYGEVPPSIGRLAHLEWLELVGSGFSGSIPSSLGNLTKLMHLDLSFNDFTGDIPLSLSNLRQLQFLSLSDLNPVTPEKLDSLFELNKLTHLSLTGMKLASEIPSFIANLTRLEYLDLGENQLMGEIPLWLMNLTRLEDLRLWNNHLKGSIPQEIFQLINLELVSFSGNDNLYGNLDPFFKLKFLTYLDLMGVELAFSDEATANKSEPKFNTLYLSSCNLPEFPQFLRSQDELLKLDLSSNGFHGIIPQWFVNITRESLYILDLSHNFLTGFEQPVKAFPWNRLEVLYLGNNQLQGSLPLPTSSMMIYEVSHNQLVGGIPWQICQASSLNYLDISNNYLDGHIPDCIGELSSSLLLLNLRGNNFHGMIPHSYPKSCKLKMINLSQNQLEGSLPRSLVNCNMLVELDIGQNRVNDTFPSWLGSLPNFQVLVLRHNNFHGRIVSRSKARGDFLSLRIIDLSHNFHTGSLPYDYLRIWDAMKIAEEGQTITSGATNMLPIVTPSFKVLVPEEYSIIITNKGNDMLYTKVLTVFRVIDFSSNNFTGGISDSIGELRGLQALNLSNNNLEGRIPSSLSNIKYLESLDLSTNKLSGRIPEELTQLTFLEVFNVSYNNLEGKIPQGRQFDTFDRSSFNGNPGLCGSLLSKKCGDTHGSPLPPPGVTSDEEKDSDVIDWVIRAIGCVGGFAVGCAIGIYITDRNHEWFVETFGRRKRQKPRTRLQGAQRHRR